MEKALLNLSVFHLIFLLTFPCFLLSGQSNDNKPGKNYQEKTISLWSFNADIPGFATDKIQNIQDTMYGKPEYVKGVRGKDVVSCAGPIMDHQCMYSHVRIIESNDARVVIHLRYALADAFYDFEAVSDDGRGEWCYEYHTLYPDHLDQTDYAKSR